MCDQEYWWAERLISTFQATGAQNTRCADIMPYDVNTRELNLPEKAGQRDLYTGRQVRELGIDPGVRVLNFACFESSLAF